jgi:hypothetical protein
LYELERPFVLCRLAKVSAQVSDHGFVRSQLVVESPDIGLNPKQLLAGDFRERSQDGFDDGWIEGLVLRWRRG